MFKRNLDEHRAVPMRPGLCPRVGLGELAAASDVEWR